MIKVKLLHEGQVVKRIRSRVHESVILEQIKNYNQPWDELVIVEGDLSEDAKGILRKVAKKIVPAAMAAGMALGGAGGAQAHLAGTDRSIGQHLSDIFSPNYQEIVRQRRAERETERREWDAKQAEIRRARIERAREEGRAEAQGIVGRDMSGSSKIYDQAKLSQDGKFYNLYDLNHQVIRIPVEGTEFVPADSQRLSHYITRGGKVYYVRHTASTSKDLSRAEESLAEDPVVGSISTIKSTGSSTPGAAKTRTSSFSSGQKDDGALELDKNHGLNPQTLKDLEKAGIEVNIREKQREMGSLEKRIRGLDESADVDVNYHDQWQAAFLDVYEDLKNHPSALVQKHLQPAMEQFKQGNLQEACHHMEIIGSEKDLDEGLRSKLAAAGIAASLALGALSPSYAADAPQAPTAVTQTAPDTADPADVAKHKLNIRPSFKRQQQQTQADNDTVSPDDAAQTTLKLRPSIKRPAAESQQEGSEHDKRHGSPYDRGSADRYYGRGIEPHKGGVGGDSGPRITDLTPAEIAAYMAGYREEKGRKVWEGRMKDIDIEHQDYENMSPLAFRNRYHKSKEEWYDQHKDLLEPKKTDKQPVQEGFTNPKMQDILDRYEEAWRAFKAGGDIDENPDFFDALFDYFADSGEMPYEVAKARTEDPIEWISQQMDRLAGNEEVSEVANDIDDIGASPADQAAADKHIIMQIRKAADYERPTTIEVSDGKVTVTAAAAQKILAAFDRMRPDSKELMQHTLNTKHGFEEILGFVGESAVDINIEQQARARVDKLMQEVFGL